MNISCVALVLGLVSIALARDLPFPESDRQAGCSGEGQRCELSSQPCCSNLECRLRPNPDEEYVDETEGERIRRFWTLGVKPDRMVPHPWVLVQR